MFTQYSRLRSAFQPFIAILLVLLLGTCDLFKVGFGNKVDLKDPTAQATNVLAGQYVRGILELSGTTTDDVGATAVQVKPGNGAWVDAVMGEGGTWTASIDTISLPDGETTFILKAKDAFGNTGEKALFLFVDNTPPVVLVKNPVFNKKDHGVMTSAELAAAYKYNQKVTVSGGAADNQRLRSVTLTVYNLDGSLAADPVTIEGQFDWSASFTPPEGSDLVDFIISVRGTDYAGNESSRFYTAADIRAAFPGLSSVPPADELVLIERGQVISGIAASALIPLARPAGTTSGQYALIDPNSDLPKFIISNPSEAGDETGNILSPLSRIVGMVRDDDGVDADEVMIRSRSGLIPWDPTDDTGWVNVDTVSADGSGLTATFEHLFNPYLSVGNHLLQVSARDVNGLRSMSQPVAFRVEASPSVITVLSHTDRQLVRGDQTIQLLGTVADPDGITLVEILFDVTGQSFLTATGTNSWDITSPATASALSWTVGGSGAYGYYNAGEMPIIIRATDTTGTSTIIKMILLVDTVSPTVTIYTPSSGALLNGAVSIKGSTTDNFSLASVQYQMGLDADGPDNIPGNADDWQNFSNLYNWQLDIPNIDIYASPTYSTYNGANETWDFVFHVRATDSAGNVSLFDYPLILDPAGDSPRVSILQPSDNAIVGGTIRLIGTAIDDDGVDLVQVRINRNAGFGAGPVTNTNFTDVTDFWNGTIDGPDGDTNDLWEDEASWVAATPSSAGNWTNWYISFNQAKEFNTDGEADPRWIQIQVRSRDINGKYGNPVLWNLRIDSRIPEISNIYVDGDSSANATPDATWGTPYSLGMVTRGQIWLRSLIRDQGGFSPTGKIEVEWDSPSLVADRIDDEASKTTYMGVVGGYDQYRMHLPIDTTASGFFPNSTGEMRLTIVAYDNSEPQFITREMVRINVDNVYPGSSYTGNASTIVGNEYRVAGTATDAGSVSGISHVIAYFVRGGNVLVIKPGSTANQTPISATLSARNMANGGVVENVLFPSLADNRFFVQIDRADDLATGNLDGDGYKENFTATAGGRDWEAYVDSELVQDGAVDVHYVVFDHVGNATHYMHTANVRNHPPVIGTVTLGTDLNGNGTTNDNIEERPAAFSFGASTDLVTGFTARNNLLYLSIGQTEGTPNGTLTYTARIGAVNLKPANSTPNTVEPGYSNFVADSIGDANNVAVVLRVTDSLGYYDERTVRVNLDNIDDLNPTLAIALMGRKYTTGSNDSAKSVISVASYNENIVMDTVPEPDVRLGHVEYASFSGDGDADLSGKVIIRGKAWDNQRLASITLSINGGAAITVANTVSNTLTSVYSGPLDASHNWSFSIEDPNLTLAYGNAVNWALSWNSASIAGRAASNVSLALTAYDALGRNSGSSLTVDVVPYITDILTGMDTGTRTFIKRSALGRYTVNQDAANPDTTNIEIRGFNFYPGAGGIRIGANTYTPTDVDSTNFAYARMNKSSITASGAVSVTTNTIASINNTNANAAYVDSNLNGSYDAGEELYNSEAKTYFPDLTDDRYLYAWNMNSRTAWSGRTEAIMRANVNGSGVKTGTMDWMFVNNAQTVQFNGNALANSWTIRGGDFGYNSSGTMMHIFLHDMNWSSGNDGWQYHGSVQWGKGTDNEGGAFNWHRANQDRLGVGNLSFNGDANYAYGDKVMTRYSNLTIVPAGTNNATANLVAYFDKSSTSRSIVFWAFYTGYNSGSVFTARTTMDNDGGVWYSDLEKATDGNTGADYNVSTNLNVGLRTPFTGRSRFNVTSGSADSSHFDLKYDATRTNAYLIYFDETNSQLLLRYNNDPMVTPTAWSTAVTVDSQAGQYVRAILDASGRLHAAYYDSANSLLKYALLTPTLDGSNNITAVAVTECVVVDALFTSGMYNAITLRDFGGGDVRPVIANYSITYGGTRNAIRVAWPTTTVANIDHGASAVTGDYTGNWEVVTVCSSTPPAQDRVFIETNNTGYTGDIVIGYNGGYLEEASLLGGY